MKHRAACWREDRVRHQRLGRGRLLAVVIAAVAGASCGGNAASRLEETGVGTASDGSTSESPALNDPPGEMNASMPDRPVEVEVPAIVPTCSVRPNPDGLPIVTMQAQVDELAGCEVIDEDLIVDPPEGVGLDLRPLAALRRVTGSVTLGCNPFASTDGCLESGERSFGLDGLENLESVASLTLGGLRVSSLASLRNLRQVESDLTIVNCNELASLDGLDGATVSTVSLWQNARLSSLKGLTLPVLAEQVHLQGNPMLTDISALATVISVNHLELREMPLESLDVLRNLTDIGSLYLMDLLDLRDVSGISGIREIDTLYLEHTALENLAGLRLASIRELNVRANLVLTDIDAVSVVAYLGALEVTGNPALERLPSFTHVPSITRVHVYDNAALVEGPSFGSLPQMGGSGSGAIFFSSNPKLRRVDGFPILQEAATIEIRDNASLEAVTFPQLQRAFELRVTCNLALPDASLAPLLLVSSGNRELGGNQGAEALCQTQ